MGPLVLSGFEVFDVVVHAHDQRRAPRGGGLALFLSPLAAFLIAGHVASANVVAHGAGDCARYVGLGT